jgi:hypothetical protein
MQGVTVAIVLFIFYCVLFPKMVRNKPQFYAALILIFAVIILDALAHVISSTKFDMFAYFAVAVLQILCILVLFLAAGGLSARELGGEMLHAIEVIRRGEEEKEIIIPRTGQQPRVKEEAPPPPPIKLED